jgi:hypothetical protein
MQRDCPRQRRRELRAADSDRSVKAPGKAAQDLRQDHARVPACTHQRAVGRGLGNLSSTLQAFGWDLLVGGPHGKQHVRACVAIGHREHVQGVDDLVMAIEPGHAGQEQIAQHHAIQGMNCDAA